MRVAVVCPYDLGVPGGVQDQAIRLVRWLSGAGADAVLIGPGSRAPEEAVLLGSTTAVPINRSRAPISLDPRAGRRLRTALDDGFDVVHVHEPLVPTVGIAAMRVGAPRVATFHADPPPWLRSAYRSGAGILRSLLGGAIVTAVSPIAASAIDGITEYRVIPNGIDVDDYTTGPKQPGRVTFLGRDDPRKGLAIMLEAWPAINAAVPDATLHVVGADGSATIDGVTFLGRVTEEVKRRELAASAVHVAPNLGAESFGIVVLEAMAAGAAIVASDLPAFAFVGGETAALTPPGDRTRLSEGVVRLLTDPSRAAERGAAARARAREFDGPIVAAEYLAAYEDALG